MEVTPALARQDEGWLGACARSLSVHWRGLRGRSLHRFAGHRRRLDGLRLRWYVGRTRACQLRLADDVEDHFLHASDSAWEIGGVGSGAAVASDAMAHHAAGGGAASLGLRHNTTALTPSGTASAANPAR